jgi:hypothetical protein
MNWTLNGYKTYIGLTIVGVGAIMKAVGLEGGDTANLVGMMLAGVGASGKIVKQLKGHG